MTDKKISELTSITGANVSDANDVLPIVDTSVATTKKITRAELFKSVSSVDLAAIAETKAVTAVDVFVYDTSKDSDGGAWRKRTQHTSWYNETLNTATRGARREFPAVAVIVAESNKVTIYDGDDPSLPMWMVFDRPGPSLGILADGTGQTHTAITAIKAMNGKLFSAKGLAPANNAWGGITSWDLISEIAIKVTTRSTGFVGTAHIPFSERNSITVTGLTFSTPNPQLVNDTANDIAVTVLPDAPIDPATGLPVPTIAVATAGGVSVIKDDGTVVDITYGTYNIARKIGFRDDNSLTFTIGSSITAQGWVHVFHDIPTSDIADPNGYAKGSSDEHYAALYNAAYNLDLQWPGAFSNNTPRHFTPLAWGSPENLIKLAPNKSDPSKGMLSAITSTYNTGWMNGDIKGAFLSSTNTASLVGGTDDDRSVNGNDLTVNGTITRSPVATGAELVAYSGFSSSNYLEGTDASYVDTLYALGWEQTSGVWGFKRGVVSAAPIDGLSITGSTLKIAGTKPKALIRLTATVPTADQLAKIEADERPLFQENAACTIAGTSDAVTALAHDPDTGLLHVGSSYGRSVFQGLRRVSNTTTAVGTAISASNSLVVEE